MGEMQVIDKLACIITIDELSVIAQEEGVTVRSVLKAIADGMKSNLPVKLNNSGEIISNSVGQPDMSTRHKFVGSATEVLRLVKKEVPVIGKIEHSWDKEDISRMELIMKEMIKLEEIRRASPMQRGDIIETTATSTA